MAQVEVRVFTPRNTEAIMQDVAHIVVPTVAEVHYGIETVSPGDITLVVPQLNTDLSSSDADFEVEISEGSENWPRDVSGVLLAHDEAAAMLNERARRISDAISSYAHLFLRSHNIFEVTGQATGWFQYKPRFKKPF